MQLRVLGTLELVADGPGGGATVPLRSPLLRRLLSVLTVSAGAVVSTDRIADAVWGGEAPADPEPAVHNLIWRLRSALRRAGVEGDGMALRTQPPGYLLDVSREVLDAFRFGDLAAEAREAAGRGDAARAAALLDDALGRWRGPAYAEFADDDFARVEAARLTELLAAAREDRVDAALALGDHGDAVRRAEGLVADHPLRERPRAQLLLALYRGGRQADALQAYREYREVLDAELGLLPSPALQELHEQVLRQDPSLDLRVTGGPGEIPSDGAGRSADAPGGDRSGSERAGGDTAGNVRRPLNELVGRERDLAGLTDALGRARLVTVTGVGGVGKTRLAVEVAAGVPVARYPDGAWIVELAAVEHPDRVADAVASVLGVRRGQGRTVVDRLVEFLRPARLLLVLDNCEHVLSSAAALTGRILPACHGVTVLATSREPLGVAGEHLHSLAPLAVPGQGGSPVPAGGQAPPDAVPVEALPSVALFTERARAALPGFAVTGANAVAVAEICRRLDGLPLALELAASRVRSMHPQEMADRLGERFRLLRSTSRATPERQRTLRGAVDWSYRLLDPDERRAFDRLSVFAGSFTLDAAEAVCDDPDTVDLVLRLVDRSLVVAHLGNGTTAAGGPSPATRYSLLETLREYGRERLAERDETQAVRRAHAEHLVALAETADRMLRTPQEAAWVRRLVAESDDLRAAHTWALRHELPLALRLSAALVWFADSAMSSELAGWAERAADAAAEAGVAHPALPVVLASAAAGARNTGDLTRAADLAARALAASAGPDDPSRRYALMVASDVALFQGMLDDADRLAADALRLSLAAGDDGYAAYSLNGRAFSHAYRGARAEALELTAEADRLARRAGNPSALGGACFALAESMLDDDPQRALALLQDAIALARSVDNRHLLGVALVTAASLSGRHGDPREALRLFGEAIEHWRRMGNRTHQWTTLRNLVTPLLRLGADEPAAVLLGAVTGPNTAAPVYGPDAERLAATRTLLAARLGDQRLAALDSRGRALRDDEVVAEASAVIDALLGAAAAGRPAHHVP